MSSGEKPRSLPLLPLLALLIILPVLLDGGLEYTQQKKFVRLKEALDRAIYPLEDVATSFDSAENLIMVKGKIGGPFRVGRAGVIDANPRWDWWRVEAIPNPPGTDKIGVLIQLSQKRVGMLLSSRVTIAPLHSTPPALTKYLEELFRSRGIPYELANGDNSMSK